MKSRFRVNTSRCLCNRCSGRSWRKQLHAACLTAACLQETQEEQTFILNAGTRFMQSFRPSDQFQLKTKISTRAAACSRGRNHICICEANKDELADVVQHSWRFQKTVGSSRGLVRAESVMSRHTRAALLTIKHTRIAISVCECIQVTN